MKKLLSTLTCLAACAVMATPANADVVVDISGIGVPGTPGSVVLTVDNVSGTVTDVAFDFNYTPQGPSWTSELEISVIAPDAANIFGGTTSGDSSETVDVEFGGQNDNNNNQPFFFAGNSGLLNGNSSSGTWTITLGENFDDASVDPDGIFGAGSTITISGVNAAVIPEPASAAFLGIFALGMISRRRR